MQKHTSELERETQKEELAFKKQVKELGSGFEVQGPTTVFLYVKLSGNKLTDDLLYHRCHHLGCAINSGRIGLED